MKTIKLFASILLTTLATVFTVAITLYGLQVSNDLRNVADDFSNTLGFAMFFAYIIFFWTTIWSIVWKFVFYLKALFANTSVNPENKNNPS